MEVRIGIQHVARELVIETVATAQEVGAAVEAALTPGGVLDLADDKGKRVLVPGTALGYVQVGESEKGRVGFGKS